MSNLSDIFDVMNVTEEVRPPPMRPSETPHYYKCVTYTMAFCVGFIGNVTMLCILFRKLRVLRQGRRRVYMLLLHMNLADLSIVLISLPKEIFHAYTIGWYAGELLCKITKFFDVFGIYVSANVLVVISIDRYLCIVHPFSVLTGNHKTRVMLMCAWIIASIFSVPQLFLFEVARHPLFPTFTQCVSCSFKYQGAYPYPDLEVANTIINFMQAYAMPLVVIVACYSRILCSMSTNSSGRLGNRTEGRVHLTVKRKDESSETRSVPNVTRQPSTLPRIEAPPDPTHKARTRTLKMTLVMVISFVICWTPYYAMTVKYFLSKPTGDEIQRSRMYAVILNSFAVLNSCLNPYLYGYFSFNMRKELSDLRTYGLQPNPNQAGVTANAYSGTMRHESHFASNIKHSKAKESSLDSNGALKARGLREGGIDRTRTQTLRVQRSNYNLGDSPKSTDTVVRRANSHYGLKPVVKSDV